MSNGLRRLGVWLVCAVTVGLIAAAALPAAARKKSVHAKVTAKQAEATALQKYPGGKLAGKTELENEDGKWQYAVLVSTGGKLLEVQVDANTGKIANVEQTSEAEEAREKKEEKAKGKTGKKSEKKEKDEKDEK